MMSTKLQETKEPPRTLKSIINSPQMQEQFGRVLPQHLSAERFTRIALTALTKTPDLKECSQESLFKCLLDLSAIGLEPDGRKAHLIPFNNKKLGVKECTLIVDYKGLIELVRRDKDVVDVQCITIRENDNAEFINGELQHSFNPSIERGEVVSVYTTIKWSNGHKSFGEPMSRKEAEKVKGSSKTGQYGPWKDWFDEMWKKSAIRRDSKMWPLSSEVFDAISKSDDHEFDLNNQRNITPKAKSEPKDIFQELEDSK